MDAAIPREVAKIEEEDTEPRLRFRTIFISDIHLGTPGCQAAALLSVLRHTESRELYLVGDIIDGDLFDAVVQGARWLAHVGDALYVLSLEANRWFNRLRARVGLPYWSLSQFLKQHVKNAVGYITRFEEALAQEARRRGFDGVVCGHIHKAEIRDIGGVRYCNDGDWVESLTALVELESGELRIMDWKALPQEWHDLAHMKGAALAYPAGD